MKTASISNQFWDTSGDNNWARPSSLNTYLNSDYYNKLNATTKNQIISKDWSIGVGIYGDNNMNNQISNENSTKWNGKVALATVSEYIRSNSNKSSCGTFDLYTDNYSSCKNTTWMFLQGYDWWTLSPIGGDSNLVFSINYRGSIYYTSETDYDWYGVRPVVYLSSEVKLSGSGTQSDPYVVS